MVEQDETLNYEFKPTQSAPNPHNSVFLWIFPPPHNNTSSCHILPPFSHTKHTGFNLSRKSQILQNLQDLSLDSSREDFRPGFNKKNLEKKKTFLMGIIEKKAGNRKLDLIFSSLEDFRILWHSFKCYQETQEFLNFWYLSQSSWKLLWDGKFLHPAHPTCVIICDADSAQGGLGAQRGTANPANPAGNTADEALGGKKKIKSNFLGATSSGISTSGNCLREQKAETGLEIQS